MARAGETDLDSPRGRDVAGAREKPQGFPKCRLCGQPIEPGTAAPKRPDQHIPCRDLYLARQRRKHRELDLVARPDVTVWLSELIAAAPGTLGLGFATEETLLELAAQGWLGYLLEGPVPAWRLRRALRNLGAKKKTLNGLRVWKIPGG